MIFEKICIHAHRPFPSYLLVQNFLMKISLVCIKSEQYKYFTFRGLLCKFLGSWGGLRFQDTPSEKCDDDLFPDISALPRYAPQSCKCERRAGANMGQEQKAAIRDTDACTHLMSRGGDKSDKHPMGPASSDTQGLLAGTMRYFR